jgi:hypothetical protein
MLQLFFGQSFGGACCIINTQDVGSMQGRQADEELQGNVWGEPVFSVMAAGWFCEKSG